ncbi:alternate-type signal peptide domain-containing protein [Salinibacterium sp. GXW1014]|uniref:alternate-type signal peptide domain-containing protein n=1 Tax=Salinibacterium sp. GXW1014 TaxID=3377838 RepID=UPI003839F562
MNKLLKGSIAGAAGIALLLGGAGTLASWNSSVSAANTGSSATITAGTLNVQAKAGSNGTWTVKHGTGAPQTVANIATFRAVPGDQLTFSRDFTVTATGDNLEAELALSGSAISVPSSPTTADTSLANLLGSSATFAVNGTSGSTLAVNAGTTDVTVSATITFPNGAAGAENGAMAGRVDLSGFAVTVSQTN